jgi:hypothetical protein
MEVSDGRAASAILGNGFLDYCRDLGAEVHVLSPGALFQPFVDRYRCPGVRFSYISIDTPQRVRYPRVTALEARLGRRFGMLGLTGVQRLLWRLVGERLAAADAACWENELNANRPDCFITADLNLGFGKGLIARCRQKGIPTVGNVFSWDHPYSRQPARPDRLTCWSPEVRNGLVHFGGFSPDQIEVIGAPAFDQYIGTDVTWTKSELCSRIGLDPNRPIIVYASLGQLRQQWDETGTFREFLAVLEKSDLPGPPQVVLRLHPLSVDHYFEEFRSRPDVRVSRYTGYCPGLRWWPSRDEVVFAGNLLRHADVCVSPGSTMTVEAAIFDTPTVVPAFNPAIPEEYESYFRKNWLNKHLRFLTDHHGMCLAETPEEAVSAVRRALGDRSWLAEGRRAVREQLLGPLDGQATKRLAEVAVNTATRNRQS